MVQKTKLPVGFRTMFYFKNFNREIVMLKKEDPIVANPKP